MGFYKLNEESIAMIREDLAQEYQALADRHSDEIKQLLEEFGDNHIETSLEFQAYENERKHAE